MAQHTERMVSLRQRMFNVQLVEGGSGPNLLFLHGAGGYTGWTPFLDRLAADFHVYAPAHPGMAESDGLEHLDDLWDLMVFYDDLARELGLDTTYLVGHSYGGMLAAELAAFRPERVSRLVLVAPLGLWLEDTPIPDFFVLTPSEIAPLLWHDPESTVAQAERQVPEEPEAKMEHQLSNVQTLTAAGKFIWPIPDRGLPKRAHRIAMPTLLLWGESDGLVPPAYGNAFKELLPQATLQTIPQCGHRPQVERPDAFDVAVREFLRG